MRNLVVSIIALAAITGAGGPAKAQPVTVQIGPGVQAVQYYEPDWREREEWRRRREIEFRHREEWRRREEWRALHGYPPPPPPGYYPPPPPPPGYGPRY